MLLINGTFLGIYVYQASTFATILMAPSYLFQTEWLGYVQLVQVLDCVIMVPLLGYGSDILARKMSTWKNGVFQVRIPISFTQPADRILRSNKIL